MVEIKLTIVLLDDSFVICRLSHDATIPEPSTIDKFYSITRTSEELSVVCTKESAPDDAKCDYGWRCFKVKGPLDFSLIGIIASISASLSEAGVSIFTISTFNTDYFLVKEENLDVAIQALINAEHMVENSSLGKAER